MIYGVGFIPSIDWKTKTYLTDIDAFLCPLEPVEIINKIEHVKDEKGFSHPLEPFENINKEELPYIDTIDGRSKIFESREEAIKYINRIMKNYRNSLFDKKSIFNFIQFDDREIEI